MSKNWLTATASDLGRGIGAGEIDPRDLAAAYLDSMERHPMTGRIYARSTAERAMGPSPMASRMI